MEYTLTTRVIDSVVYNRLKLNSENPSNKAMAEGRIYALRLFADAITDIRNEPALVKAIDRAEINAYKTNIPAVESYSKGFLSTIETLRSL
jgi:hypothetical protein